MRAGERKHLIFSIFLALLIAAATYFGLFYTVDSFFTDSIYNNHLGTNSDIVIIGVDEETLNAYGDFTVWGREKTAETINFLTSGTVSATDIATGNAATATDITTGNTVSATDITTGNTASATDIATGNAATDTDTAVAAVSSTAPAIIGVDFLIIDERGTVDAPTPSDEMLISASLNHPNVVYASNLVYRGTLVESSDHQIYYDTQNIDMIEQPFERLRTETRNGYSNMLAADDGRVRYADYKKEFEGDTHYSFAYEIYRAYCETRAANSTTTAVGVTSATANNTTTASDNAFAASPLYIPRTNTAGQFQFFYSGKVGEFSHVSMVDVLDGKVPKEAFKDKIVLIGAYAPGFQDAYPVAVDRGNPMHGVEIHANIIQSLMDEKTATEASHVLIAIITFIILAGFLIAGRRMKLAPALITSVIVAIAWTLVGVLLAGGDFGSVDNAALAGGDFSSASTSESVKGGITIPVFYLILGLILSDAYFIINKYILEKVRRKRTLSVFKQYVAPQVVDELAKNGDFELKLGGEKRDIAVMFVDIRGFTPLSEGLEPEKVVEILNEYLAHTTQCIFNHGGTLDKFVGDATMAVFNAPFDQEDYIFEAVATAWDIASGAEKLGEQIEKEHGKRINFGVGVNCGPAVVGNIGCNFRMDYTAIGDTVNTAARLEANAKGGQVLISEKVFKALEGRISAESIGAIPLKGKSEKLEVYEVTSIYTKPTQEA